MPDVVNNLERSFIFKSTCDALFAFHKNKFLCVLRRLSWLCALNQGIPLTASHWIKFAEINQLKTKYSDIAKMAFRRLLFRQLISNMGNVLLFFKQKVYHLWLVWFLIHCHGAAQVLFFHFLIVASKVMIFSLSCARNQATITNPPPRIIQCF